MHTHSWAYPQRNRLGVCQQKRLWYHVTTRPAIYAFLFALQHRFLLATPHLGSFFEKFANVTTTILENVPNWQTRLVGKAINLRSAGIKDLRYGYLTENDWKDKNPDQFLSNNKIHTQKLPGVSYYAISGRLTQEKKHWVNHLFGDILVRTESVTARSDNPAEFNFSPENHHEFAQTNHFKLTTLTEVFEKITTLNNF